MLLEQKNNIERREDELLQGIVDRYSEHKGYGFIILDDGKEVLVERSSLDMTGYKTLNVGDLVTFRVEEGIRGLKAKNVKKVSPA
jgi:CspA family cold shock protein